MDDTNLVVMQGGGKPEKKALQISERGQSLLPSKTLTKKELDKFRERVMREYTPEALVTLMEGLLARIKVGDTQAMQLMAKVVKVVEEAPMVAIQNNQTNYNGGGRKPGRRFEDLVAGPQEARMRSIGGGKTTVIDTTAG